MCVDMPTKCPLHSESSHTAHLSILEADHGVISGQDAAVEYQVVGGNPLLVHGAADLQGLARQALPSREWVATLVWNKDYLGNLSRHVRSLTHR